MLKAVFSMTILAVLTVGQLSHAAVIQHSPQIFSTLEQNIEQDVAPCSNGFDDVNVCQLRS